MPSLVYRTDMPAAGASVEAEVGMIMRGQLSSLDANFAASKALSAAEADDYITAGAGRGIFNKVNVLPA